MVHRKSLLALAAVVAACAGCSAGAASRFAVRPEPSLPAPTVAVTTLVEENNRNAALVSTFYDTASVSGQVGRNFGGLEGYIALEQPNHINFKLSQGGFSSKEYVNLGSNPDEFWFWVRNNEERAVYVGEYGQDGSVPTGLPFQPDWIVEALGLRPIPEAEAATLQVDRGPSPGTITLTHLRDDSRGGTLMKQTILDERTHQVVQHRYFAADKKTEVARIEPSQYRSIPAASEDGSAAATVVIPLHLKIDLFTSKNPKENMHLTVQLKENEVRVNSEFPEQKRTAWFTVPKYAGYQNRRMFAEPAYAAGGETRTYESRPSPPTGARLGNPEPIGADDNALLRSDPAVLEPDLPGLPGEPRGADAIVRPGLPQAPGREDDYPAPDQLSRRGPLGSGFYR